MPMWPVQGGGAAQEGMAHPEATDIITTSLLSAGILNEEEDAVTPSAKKSPGPKRLKGDESFRLSGLKIYIW